MHSELKKWEETSKENQYWDSVKMRKIQEKEAKLMIKWLKKLNRGNYRITEVGCGNGYLGLKICEFLTEENKEFSYCLTDLVPECIEKAKKTFADFNKKEDVDFKQLNVYEIDKLLGANSQDIMISTGFASAATYKDAVPAVARSLKKDGILICDFINHFSPGVFLRNIPKSISRLTRNKKYANDANSKYYHFGRIGIGAYFERYDLELLEIKHVGLLHNPIVAIFKKMR